MVTARSAKNLVDRRLEVDLQGRPIAGDGGDFGKQNADEVVELAVDLEQTLVGAHCKGWQVRAQQQGDEVVPVVERARALEFGGQGVHRKTVPRDCSAVQPSAAVAGATVKTKAASAVTAPLKAAFMGRSSMDGYPEIGLHNCHRTRRRAHVSLIYRC